MLWGDLMGASALLLTSGAIAGIYLASLSFIFFTYKTEIALTSKRCREE